MYLRACGVENEPGTQVTWEQFLRINCILKHGSLTDAEYTDFFVKVFDPYDQGFVPKKQYVNIVEQLFNSQFAAEIAEEDKDSMSADIKNKFELYES